MNVGKANVTLFIKDASEIFAELTGQATSWMGNGVELDKMIIEIAKMLQAEANKPRTTFYK